MFKKFLVSFVMCAVALGLGSYVFAAEAAVTPPAPEAAKEAAPAPVNDEADYAYGAVSSVAAEQIVIKDYDYDKEADVDVAFVINAATQFVNVTSWNEIAKDDWLDIEYVEKDGKKVALSVVVEAAMPEEAAAPEAPAVPEAAPEAAPAAAPEAAPVAPAAPAAPAQQ